MRWAGSIHFLLPQPADPEEFEAELMLACAAAGVTLETVTVEPCRPQDWVTRHRAAPAADHGRAVRRARLARPRRAAGRAWSRSRSTPALAFGSGEHATTQSCLRAIDRARPGAPLPARAGRRLRLGRPVDRRRQMLAGARRRGRQRPGRRPGRRATICELNGVAARAQAVVVGRLPPRAGASHGTVRPDPREHPGRPVDRAGAGAAAASGAGRPCGAVGAAGPAGGAGDRRPSGAGAAAGAAVRPGAVDRLGAARAGSTGVRLTVTPLLRVVPGLAISRRLSSRCGARLASFWSFPRHAEDEDQAERREALLVDRHRQGEARRRLPPPHDDRQADSRRRSASARRATWRRATPRSSS